MVVITPLNLYILNGWKSPLRFGRNIVSEERKGKKFTNEIKKKYEIDANEMRKISYDILIWEPMARRTRFTRVLINELDEEEP